MDLQSLVTENLAGDADESLPSLQSQFGEEFSPREALSIGRDALQSLQSGSPDWPDKVGRFAVRMTFYKITSWESLGTRLLVATLDAWFRPETVPNLEELIKKSLERVVLDLRTSSYEEASTYLEDFCGDEWVGIAAEAAGVKPETVQRWETGTEPAQTKQRRIFALVRTLHMLDGKMNAPEAMLWLRNPMSRWPKTPLECISTCNHSQVPYEISSSLKDL